MTCRSALRRLPASSRCCRLPRTFTRQHGCFTDRRPRLPEWADVRQAVERVRVRRDISAGSRRKRGWPDDMAGAGLPGDQRADGRQYVVAELSGC